jgi:hypothetical protein
MEVWESSSILKYSEGNAIKLIVPVRFGTIDGEQTYTMRKENEIVAPGGFLVNEIVVRRDRGWKIFIKVRIAVSVGRSLLLILFCWFLIDVNY